MAPLSFLSHRLKGSPGNPRFTTWFPPDSLVWNIWLKVLGSMVLVQSVVLLRLTSNCCAFPLHFTSSTFDFLIDFQSLGIHALVVLVFPGRQMSLQESPIFQGYHLIFPERHWFFRPTSTWNSCGVVATEQSSHQPCPSVSRRFIP